MALYLRMTTNFLCLIGFVALIVTACKSNCKHEAMGCFKPTAFPTVTTKTSTATTTTPTKDSLINPNGNCKLEPVGCFKDKESKRALDEEILNERDITNPTHNGHVINWSDYHSYLEEFACRCAEKALSKGYSIIGLQFYGECWSGPKGEQTFNKHGESKGCVDGNNKPYVEAHSDCRKHVGKQYTNFVYRVAVPGCTKLNIEPVGCFHDNMKSPRPVPNYIMNERDPTNKGYNGHEIDWDNWKSYSPQMICRCAEKAKEKGETYFAIQYYGECWSGKEGETEFDRNGPSNMCVNEALNKCKCNSYNCVGKQKTNYVYRFNKDEF